MNREGFIYIIKAETGHYKIGRTKSIPDRMNFFRVRLPFRFETVHTFPCVDMFEAERQLHLIFRDKRQFGEWFNLTDEDVDILKTVAGFYHPEEFQKADRAGRLWGMPELWMGLPECADLQSDHAIDRYSVYHRSMYGLPELFYRVW